MWRWWNNSNRYSNKYNNNRYNSNKVLANSPADSLANL